MNQKSIYDLSRIERYMMQMRPVLSKKALFSDGTKDYRSPAEPRENDKVTIRFRTKRDNVDMVWLCSREKKQRMKRTETKWDFDYYSVEIQLGSEPFFYYFKVVTGILECYYDRYGVNDKPREEYYFCIVPGFSTPEWAKGAVMYQILVDRFYNGNPAGDVLDGEYYYVDGPTKHVENWAHCPQGISVREFYGGDLEGVRQKLDYLQELGIEVLYFNPLFVSPSNHKYDCQDYDYIDPHVSNIVVDEGAVLPEGCKDNTQAARYITRVTDKRNLEASNAYFAKFVEEVHAHGMKIILDGVFNHCGSFHKWLDREKLYEQQGGYAPGAYVSGESPYRDFFAFQNQEAWPDNGSYEGWWGFETLPKLNYEGSQELWNYVLDIGRKWVSPPYNVDGWRLDVAADLGRSNEYNHEFWKKFRKAVKEANPHALILAEHYGDPSDWLQGDEWDSVMNYDAFMEPVTWFLTGMEKHSDEYRDDLLGNADHFMNAMKHHMANMMTPSLQTAMNQLSNHDHSRFLTRTNHKVGRVGCIRRTILIAHVFGIAVIRRNKQLAAKFQHLLHTFFQGAVHCFAGGDAGFHKSGMANHVPIGEIHDDHIILVHSVHKLIRHFRRAHLGLQVISSHFPGGRNKNAVFSGELGLHTSVKEESNVGVLFRFRYAELDFPGFRHNLPENIVQLFLFKNNGRGILGIVFRQRHIVHFGRYFTVKAVKFGIKESVAHLPGAVRTEIEEEHHIVVPHALLVAIGKNAGLQELIRLPLRITLLHIFGRGAGALFAAPQNDGIPCQLVAVPALVSVHRIETADNRGNFGAVRPDGFLQLANKAGSAGWRAVTAIRNGMDADIADTRFISIFDDADQMVDMAVHAAVGKKRFSARRFPPWNHL